MGYINKYKVILFDFDYTLADSSKGAYQCINYALSNLGFDDADESKSKSTIGLSLSDTLQALVGKQDDKTTNEFAKLFVEKADEVMADLTVMFADIPHIIPLFVDAGYKLGIVSTKYRYRIESILQRENLLKYFSVIVGGEDVENHKPHSESIELALKKLHIKREEILYIGDSITDEKTAKNADVDFCAMLTGVTEKNQFEDSFTNQFFYSMSQLFKWLEK
ncbi:MAG: HAD-IA family hydrolase [Clostridiales bacterium]|nr:HAD-IA family hydrolase [Clostridiales bacterium]